MQSGGDIRLLLEKGDKTKQLLKLKSPHYEFNLVDILGEQVSFTKSGLFPGETAIVEFDTYYRPDGISDEDFSTLKRTMRTVFENRNKDLADAETGDLLDEKTTVPFPPCGEKEKSLVLASLLHRARLLRQQLYELGVLTPEQLKKKIEEITPGKDTPIQGEENLLTRQHLLHLYKLQKFIDDYDEQQQCIHISELMKRDIEIDLDDERVKELLKQFVFFVLQGHYPLKDYRDIEPKASSVIASLEKNPLKEKFPPFLDTYKKSGSPFPPAIAKVLDAIDMDPKAMADEIKRQVELEKQEILKRIYLMIPKKDPFWTKISDPNDIATIIETLRTQNEEWDDDIQRMEVKMADADGKIKACEQAKAALEARNQEMLARIQELEDQLQNTSAGDAAKDVLIQQLRDEKKVAEDDFKRRSDVLQKAIDDCTAEKQALQARIKELEAQNANLNDELAKLKQRVTELEAIKTQSEKDVNELKKQHQEALAKAQEEVAGAQAAQAAAEAARKAASDELAKKETELANTKVAIQAAQQMAASTATRINEIETKINQQEAATQKVREELTAKTQEAEGYAKQLKDCETNAERLTNELQVLRQQLADKSGQTGLLNQEIEQEKAKIQKLTTSLQAEATKARDLQTLVNACKEEKKKLQQTASGGDKEIGRLAGELEVAKGQLADAKKQINEMNAIIQGLQAQLQAEKGKSTSLQKEVDTQKGVVSSQKSQLQGLQGSLQQTQGELQTMTSKAQAAEAKAGELEAKVKQVTEDSQKKLTGDISSVQKKCGEELEKTKQTYEQRLQQEKADLTKRLTDASAQQAAQTRANYEAQLQAQKQEFDRRIQEATALSGQQSGALTAEKEQLEQRLREATLASDQQKAALEQQKKDCEAKLAQLQQEFQQQLAALQKQRDELQKRLDALSASSTQEKDQIQRSLGQQKGDLERRLQEAMTTSAAQIAELKRQKEEVERQLQQTSSSSAAEQTTLSQQKEELQRRLQEVSATAAQVNEIKKQNEELQRQLQKASNNSKLSSSQLADVTKQRADIEKRFQEVSAAQTQALSRQKTDCDRQINEMQIKFNQEKAALEARIDELEKGLISLDASSQEEIAKLTQQKEDCEKRLGEQAAAYEAEIQRMKDEYDAQRSAAEAQFKEILKQLEITNALNKEQENVLKGLRNQQAQYEKLIQFVKQIASQVSAGKSITAEPDQTTPAADSLSVIVTKLKEKIYVEEGKKVHSDSLMNICNVVFLTSLLWQLNFPPLPDKPEGTDDLSVYVFVKNNFIQTFFPHIFEGGVTPTAASAFTRVKIPKEGSTDAIVASYSKKTGLYYDITAKSAGKTTATLFHGHTQQEGDIVRRFLSIFNKLTSALELSVETEERLSREKKKTEEEKKKEQESANKVKNLDDVDIVYLTMLIEKIEQLIGDYKVAYKTHLFDLENHFASTITSILDDNQPFTDKNLLTRFLVKETKEVKTSEAVGAGAGAGGKKTVTIFRVVKKEDKEEEANEVAVAYDASRASAKPKDPSVLNYAVVYYLFLVVVRDYLNHIEGTVEQRCHFPEILKK